MAKTEKKEDLRGKALKAKDLVGYDKGAVVSRTIIQKPVGTVTIFSFDKGQGLSEHTAPFDAMVEVLDGEAEISIARKPVKVKAGEFIIMPANVPHSLHAAKKFKMALIMIKA
jgi:quercetin dioxygenase-like cupin family protein